MDQNGIAEILKKHNNITTALVCLAGIALNMVASSIVAAFGLPLYLNTVGTVAVSLMGGYFPGVLVGFATNVIKAVSEPVSIYYGVLNVLIALCASFIADHGWHKKIAGVIGMIFSFAFIGGVVGALIPWFMEGLTFDGEALSGIIYSTGHFTLASSHLLSSLLMDLPDKAISVLLALAVVRVVPQQIVPYFRFSIWMQKPVSNEAFFSKNSDVRALSLRVKSLLVLVFSLLTVALVCIILSVGVFKKSTVNEHTQLARGTARLAADVIDGDRVDEYLMGDSDDEDYIKTKEMLADILFSSSEIAYLYVYRMEPDGFRVVFDIETEDTPADEVGSMIPYGEEFDPYLPQLLSGERVDPIITNDEYGYLLTVAEPVLNSEGRCVCYAIADVDMKKLNADARSFLTEMISVFLGFFILLCVFSIWLIDYNIVIPVNSIVKGMIRLSNTPDSQDGMDEDVKMFRSLGIHTGDEIENLYQTACTMTKNQAEQMRSIRRLSDSTAKMQDGLIITMADLVESRDSDTGAHVQKTAAYVKIIVEGLKKKGYYAHKITPKFMSDVVRSAPLHDIGKINIPDGVLNKPGKLTDEEYEIMKTHTTAGKKIMENAISTVEGDNYLKEARNMAAYHHERWDGKGYPEGIHGEVIPLSARIMAVADVFDALTSPRVYKPAFPLDKALSILEEGKGTQFDPKCIEVFMEALPEVKVILRKYNQDIDVSKGGEHAK